MSAGFDEVLGSFHRFPNLHQLLILRVIFAEVGAKTALAVVYMQHL
jgi:hypothetical protein